MVDRRLDQIGVIPRRLVLIVPVPRGGTQLRIFPVRTAGEQTVHCARKLRPADRRAACGAPLPRFKNRFLFPRTSQRRKYLAARLRVRQRVQHAAQLPPADCGRRQEPAAVSERQQSQARELPDLRAGPVVARHIKKRHALRLRQRLLRQPNERAGKLRPRDGRTRLDASIRVAAKIGAVRLLRCPRRKRQHRCQRRCAEKPPQLFFHLHPLFRKFCP